MLAQVSVPDLSAKHPNHDGTGGCDPYAGYVLAHAIKQVSVRAWAAAE